jgi:hypothetical protein
MVRGRLPRLAATQVSGSDAVAAGPKPFDSHAGREQLVDTVLRLAKRRIVIAADTLGPRWDQSGRIETLKSFCLASPRNTLHMVLRDAQPVRRQCPRLQHLALTFGHVIAMRCPRPETGLPGDTWLVVDDEHFVHQFHIDHPRGSAGTHLPALAKPLAARFVELWAGSDPVHTGTTLGL